MMRLVKEPLLHFLIIGAAIFAYFYLTTDRDPPPQPDQIVITDDLVQQFANQFEAVWRRKPTDGELTGLIDEFIREEIFVREALALSLDTGDAVIRRRLRQKMEFLIESSAGAVQPSEQELADFYAENAKLFRKVTKVAFEQVFLGPSATGAEIQETLNKLTDGADPRDVGKQTLLPATFPPSAGTVIDGTFGRGFFQQIQTFETGKWLGPVRSGYGLHVVRIVEREQAKTPELSTVRDAVLREWKRSKADETARTIFNRMRQQYRIVQPTGKAPAEPDQ